MLSSSVALFLLFSWRLRRKSVTLQTKRHLFINSTYMEATTLRLNTSLLNLLKEKARESHQSLNSLVEHILMDVMLHNEKKDAMAISPELQVRIQKARENYQKGNYISCNTKEELHSLLDSL